MIFQREITWAGFGEESWVTSVDEGREGLLPCRAAPQLSTEASDKRQQVAAAGLVM